MKRYLSGRVSHKKSDNSFEVDHQNRDHVNRINDFFHNCSRGGFKEFFAGQSGPNVNEYRSAFPGTDAD